MAPFDRAHLRVCMLRCTELIDLLHAYPDLYPIQEGANHVLSTLFRVVVRTVPSDAGIHTLSLDDQEILGRTLKTCSSLLVEVNTVLKAYAPIDALCLDEKTKLVILNEVVCRYAFQEDLKRLALALLTPHMSMTQRKDSWAVMLDKVQAHRDAILRHVGVIREIIEVYSPDSDFRQSLHSMHLAAHTKEKERGNLEMDAHSRVLDNCQALRVAGEDSVEPTSSNHTTCKNEVDKVFHETERNILLRTALRDCAPGNGAYISLDKDADDALREAAISKIAGSSSFIRPHLVAHQKPLAVLRTESASVSKPFNASNTGEVKKFDAVFFQVDNNVSRNVTGQDIPSAKHPMEATIPISGTSQQNGRYSRSATAVNDLKDLAEPKRNASETHGVNSSSTQVLSVLDD